MGFISVSSIGQRIQIADLLLPSQKPLTKLVNQISKNDSGDYIDGVMDVLDENEYAYHDRAEKQVAIDDSPACREVNGQNGRNVSGKEKIVRDNFTAFYKKLNEGLVKRYVADGRIERKQCN